MDAQHGDYTEDLRSGPCGRFVAVALRVLSERERSQAERLRAAIRAGTPMAPHLNALADTAELRAKTLRLAAKVSTE